MRGGALCRTIRLEWRESGALGLEVPYLSGSSPGLQNPKVALRMRRQRNYGQFVGFGG